MRKYLILAVADVSKPQQQQISQFSNAQQQHRNITIDSDDPVDTRNYNQFSKSGSMKLILKEIFPKASEELITAFEYEGRICNQPSVDPKSLVGKVLEVIGSESSRGILLLKSDQCQIVGMSTSGQSGSGSNVVMDDLFDDEDLIDLSFI